MNNAGMPGTGIGGFFYLLLAFLMPFAELHRTIVGKSSWKRGELVIRQVTIATGVVGGGGGGGGGVGGKSGIGNQASGAKSGGDRSGDWRDVCSGAVVAVFWGVDSGVGS